jgi:hypothetical protein
MAYEINNYSLRITLKAAADLSGAQYCFVKLDSSGNAALCTAATDKPIGVLQNQPIAGKEASILVEGGTKIKASAAISIGASLGTTTSNTGAVTLVQGTDTTKYVVGTALSAATAANDIISAVVSCASAARGV